jgi:transmembrane sensor
MPMTADAEEQPPIPPRVRRAAADWRVALQAEDASDATRERWRHWLQADADHRRAWQRIEAFAEKLQGLPVPLAHAALAPPQRSGRRQAAKALAVLMFTGGAAWTVREHAPWPRWVADRRTSVGERASVELPDGSRLELNADSAIDIRFTATERLVQLLAGEILVATAPDRAAAADGPARPFIVQTAQGRILDVGTRFNVRQLDGRADGRSSVAVFEGAVELRPHRGPPRLLRAGQQATFTREEVGPVDMADETLAAWTRGMLVARDMPLADFLAELTRHRRGHLGCDPAVARLAVSGTYPLADTDRVLDMLQATLPVAIDAITRYWVTVRPRGPASGDDRISRAG